MSDDPPRPRSMTRSTHLLHSGAQSVHFSTDEIRKRLHEGLYATPLLRGWRGLRPLEILSRDTLHRRRESTGSELLFPRSPVRVLEARHGSAGRRATVRSWHRRSTPYSTLPVWCDSAQYLGEPACRPTLRASTSSPQRPDPAAPEFRPRRNRPPRPVQQLLDTRTKLTVGRAASFARSTVQSKRLASMWLPDEPVIYVGLAGTSLTNPGGPVLQHAPRRKISARRRLVDQVHQRPVPPLGALRRMQRR